MKIKMMGVVVAVLLLIKFGLLPVLVWQNETIDEIKQYERRNSKAENLLASQEQIMTKLASLSDDYKSKAQVYPAYADKTLFRLETQIMFELLLKQNGLEQTRFFWQDSEDTGVFENLHKAKFNVSFVGLLKDYALLHSKLSTLNKAYKINNMSIRVSDSTAKSSGQVKATISVQAFYWLGGIQS